MADYIQTQNPWLVGAGLARGFGNTMQGIALQLPEARARAAQMALENEVNAERIPLLQAQTQREQEHARVYASEAASNEDQSKAAQEAGVYVGSLLKAMQSGQDVGEDTFEQLGQKLTRMNPKDVGKTLAEMAKVVGSYRQRGDEMGFLAAANNNPRFMAGVNVPQNAANFPLQGEGAVRQGPANVPAGAIFNPNPTEAITNTNFRPNAPAQYGNALAQIYAANLKNAIDDGSTQSEAQAFAEKAVQSFQSLLGGGMTNAPALTNSPASTNVIQLPNGATARRIQ